MSIIIYEGNYISSKGTAEFSVILLAVKYRQVGTELDPRISFQHEDIHLSQVSIHVSRTPTFPCLRLSLSNRRKYVLIFGTHDVITVEFRP